MRLISTESLSLGYDRIPVVSGITLNINEGEYVCFVGENGSGKTTLMKGLLGLIKPISGSISYENIEPDEIGYLPQTSYISKYFPASVKEVVLSGCLNSLGMRPFYSATEKEMAKVQMKLLDVYKLKDKRFGDLSGGQRQRVLLARALCSTRKLILLDEPVAGLDPLVTKDLYDLINHLNKEHGIGIIMISHDIEAAIKYADKIAHLSSNGIFIGTADEFSQKFSGKFLPEV